MAEWLRRHHVKLQIAVSPLVWESLAHAPASWWWYRPLILGLVGAGIVVAWEAPGPNRTQDLPRTAAAQETT